MIILGIDPGYAIVGFGVVEYRKGIFRPLNYGAIETAAGTKFEYRLQTVHTDICEVLDYYKPDAVALEQLFFTTNQKTAIMVAEARGVLMLAAVNRNIPIFEYTPLQVKQAVVGYGKAIKTQVMEMTRVLLGLASVPKPDDAADALAVAICHAHTSGSALGSDLLQKAIEKQKAAETRRPARPGVK